MANIIRKCVPSVQIYKGGVLKTQCLAPGESKAVQAAWLVQRNELLKRYVPNAKTKVVSLDKWAMDIIKAAKTLGK